MSIYRARLRNTSNALGLSNFAKFSYVGALWVRGGRAVIEIHLSLIEMQGGSAQIFNLSVAITQPQIVQRWATD